MLHALGWVAYQQGAYDHAIALCTRSLTEARASGDHQTAGLALRNLGFIAYQQGNMERAQALFRESLPCLHGLGVPENCAGVLMGLASVAAARDEAERAARLLGLAEQVQPGFDRMLAPTDRAIYQRSTDRARTELGEHGYARAWAEGHTMPLEQAIADALGDAVVPGRAGPRDVPSARTAVTPSACPDGAPVALTPREREVLQLVAQGYTDQAVATRLGLQPRTVSSYLSAIYGKLGVRTRTAAAHWLLEHDGGVALP